MWRRQEQKVLEGSLMCQPKLNKMVLAVDRHTNIETSLGRSPKVHYKVEVLISQTGSEIIYCGHAFDCKWEVRIVKQWSHRSWSMRELMLGGYSRMNRIVGREREEKKRAAFHIVCRSKKVRLVLLETKIHQSVPILW